MFFKEVIQERAAQLAGRLSLALVTSFLFNPCSAQDVEQRFNHGDTTVVRVDVESAPVDSFELKPGRCVALHEGQACYAKLRFEWQLTQARAVCIKRSGSVQTMRCWPRAQEGAWQAEFESERSCEFLLIDQDSASVLGRASFTVAWVYDAKSRRQSHWRIF
jgi:hypothetical protein